ncbi:MAG: hypothetical protein QW128_08690 [Thermoprotei archaeon]
MVRKKYPVNDVLKSIINEITMNHEFQPYELSKIVIKRLEELGYYTGHVTIKRVWRIYEAIKSENGSNGIRKMNPLHIREIELL